MSEISSAYEHRKEIEDAIRAYIAEFEGRWRGLKVQEIAINRTRKVDKEGTITSGHLDGIGLKVSLG